MRPTRTWIVTGGNAGLGFQCCRFLAQQPGSLIVIACRDGRKGDAAAERLWWEGGVAEVLPLDLNALDAVRAFVEAFRRADLPPLAGIVCNAVVQIVTAPTQTADGFETTFGVNHLAHYLLVRLLLDDMGSGGNIVFVSSNTHDPQQKTGMPEPRFDSAQAVAHDLELGANAGRRRYTTSKLCNIYCTYELARQLDQSGDPRLQSIHVNAFDPGMMPGTGLVRTYPAPLRFVWNYVLPVLTLFQRNVNRPSTSGRRLAALASGQMGEFTGKYVSMGKVFPSSSLSQDASKAWDLWRVSAEMTGLPSSLKVPVRHDAEPDRVLATVLFTDIVGATEKAASLGDSRWHDLLDSHHGLVRGELARFRGREINTAGDGFLAAFDGPARAVRRARAISDGVRSLGLQIRAGLHTGECQIMGREIGGIVVHIGARIAALASPGEVLVSGTVKDLVAGSGLSFRDHGTETLTGIPGEWRLYSAEP